MKKIKKSIKKIGKSIKNFINKVGTKKIITISLGTVLSIWILLSFFAKTTFNNYFDGYILANQYNEVEQSSNINIINYTNTYLNYEKNNLTTNSNEYIFDTSLYDGVLANDNYPEIYNKYQKDIYYINEVNSEVKINVGNIEEALYYVNIDYYDLESNIDDTQLSILINGETPFHESETITLPSVWEFVSDEFSVDRYKNEIQPQSEKLFSWSNFIAKDRTGLHPKPFLYYLKPNDEITIRHRNYEFILGEVSLVTIDDLNTYEDYSANYLNETKQTDLIVVSARNINNRSDASIRLRADQNPTNLYYDTQHLKLNTILSDSWQNGGQTISYLVDVPKAGLYNLAFKYRQYVLSDMSVFRTIRVNGSIPFKELESYAFPFTQDFLNRTLVNEKEEPLWIYLDEGENEISLESNSYPYRNAIEKLKEIMMKIQNLSLEVKRYTSGGQDRFRDWDIEEYFPNAQSDINSWADELDELFLSLRDIANKKDASAMSNIKVAASRLRNIAKRINSLPSLIPQFSDGDSSVNQLLGILTQNFMLAGLEIESMMVYGNKKLPKPHPNFFVGLYEGTARLVLSFVNNPYKATKSKDDELTVWVNHPRQYIEVMQTMIDSQFEGEYRVTLSQMPDQNKLILANASNTSPDVAIGIDHYIPYEFAIRDAALDLRKFKGYEDLVSKFSKGAMIPYVFEDGVFALPETQNFWVTFYREDILNSIGITEIPQTWDEVIAILPILQSYGMNYFVPLAQFTGLKPFNATLPFIYQFGGDLYTENGMQTAINSEETLQGIKLMSDLFTLYNMPRHVASFYNHFRYGMLPIGIADLGTYLLLQNVAVELDGLWKMDLHPGVFNEESNEIVRYSAGGAQSSMILSTTKKPQAAWDFLEWWMSTEVQSEFSLTLQSTYGRTYFWNSANLEAFESASMPRQYKDIVLKQWDYMLEASRIPGAYMVEREISNAWTKIVFENVNPRQALDEAVRISNREILYKMSEFGYVENGQIVKEYKVPSIYNIDDWLTEVS